MSGDYFGLKQYLIMRADVVHVGVTVFQVKISTYLKPLQEFGACNNVQVDVFFCFSLVTDENPLDKASD